MARSLKFTVDREPIDLEVGGEHFDAPPLLAPAALAELLDMQGRMTDVFARLQPTDGHPTDPGAMNEILGFLGDIFDQIFGDESPGVKTESAVRFRARLFAKDHPFDLVREVIPSVMALVEEYTGRPIPPSSPSSTPGNDGGTPSTDGRQLTVLTPSLSPLPVSAT